MIEKREQEQRVKEEERAYGVAPRALNNPMNGDGEHAFLREWDGQQGVASFEVEQINRNRSAGGAGGAGGRQSSGGRMHAPGQEF